MLTDIPASGALPIALLGADALLAARPATPVQVLHACVAAGFVAAYPVSWGDELVARECLARLADRPRRPAVFCACPHVVRTVLESEPSADALAMASPPVAAARMVRAAYHGQPIRITYVGGCPSASDPIIDAHIKSAAFLATLLERGIVLAEQPETFEAVLPPDRRRFFSLPGGCPTAEHVRNAGYRLIERHEASDSRETPDDDASLLDVAPASGCVCSGAPFARADLEALEPPRAARPIIEPIVTVVMRGDPTIEAALALRNAAASRQSPLPSSLGIDTGAAASSDASAAADASLDEPNGTETGRLATPTADVGTVTADTRAAPDDDLGAALAGGDATESPPPELGRTEMPGPRGFTITDAPLRGGPVREFARPVFPRSEAVYEDATPRRRYTLTALLLALALGISLPLAAIGGWVLLRGTPAAVVTSDGSSVSIAEDSLFTPRPSSAVTRQADSAQAAADTARARSAASDSISVPSAALSIASPSRVDSAAATHAHDSARTGSRRTPSRVGHPKAGTPPSAGRRRLSVDSTHGPTRRLSGAAAPTNARATVDSSLRSAKPASPPELDSLVKEIARRRARVDSLNRLVDSLNRPGRPAPPFH